MCLFLCCCCFICLFVLFFHITQKSKEICLYHFISPHTERRFGMCVCFFFFFFPNILKNTLRTSVSIMSLFHHISSTVLERLEREREIKEQSTDICLCHLISPHIQHCFYNGLGEHGPVLVRHVAKEGRWVSGWDGGVHALSDHTLLVTEV